MPIVCYRLSDSITKIIENIIHQNSDCHFPFRIKFENVTCGRRRIREKKTNKFSLKWIILHSKPSDRIVNELSSGKRFSHTNTLEHLSLFMLRSSRILFFSEPKTRIEEGEIKKKNVYKRQI